MNQQLYFQQFLSGKDFATTNPMAKEMRNYVYAVGDLKTRQTMLVDPTYDIKNLLQKLEQDEMELTGVLLTHYHADHSGGVMRNNHIAGIKEILEHATVPIHIQSPEAEWVEKVTQVDKKNLVTHTAGDTLHVGEIPIELIHTPGHTPGSQCFLVENKLLTGDTLFLQGCGRTDLPGGNPEELYTSLTQVLSKVQDTAVVYPGHNYAPDASATLAKTKRTNPVFKPKTSQEWLRLFAS